MYHFLLKLNYRLRILLCPVLLSSKKTSKEYFYYIHLYSIHYNVTSKYLFNDFIQQVTFSLCDLISNLGNRKAKSLKITTLFYTMKVSLMSIKLNEFDKCQSFKMNILKWDFIHWFIHSYILFFAHLLVPFSQQYTSCNFSQRFLSSSLKLTSFICLKRNLHTL